MSLNTDRLFRRIWLANGIVLLLLMIGALVLGAFSFFEVGGPPGVQPTANGKVPAADVRPRAIRYDQPELIRNSRSTLVRVRYGTDYSERSSASMGLGSQHYERAYNPGLIVNVIFLPRDGGPGRLLLERAAFIQDLDFPREGRRGSDNPLVDSVPWITYAIALEDTDRSGRLDYEDAAELYISDLDGGNFRRVLAPGFDVLSTRVLPDRKLLVLALEGRDAKGRATEQLPQRAFRFNPRTGVLTADAGLDSLAARAGHILGRP